MSAPFAQCSGWLLGLFLANLDRVMSKDVLIDQLFCLDDAVAPNAIELYVSRLRRKLEGASCAGSVTLSQSA